MATQQSIITVFRQPGHRYVGTNPIILGAAVVFLVVAVGIWISSEDFKTFYLSPVIGWMVFRFGLPRTEKIYFFIQRNQKNDLSYGWMDDDKQRKGDLPIETWEHWYVEGLSIGKTKNYMLYVSMNNGFETVYLKEEFKSTTPPENWPQSDEVRENKPGVFQISGLKTLVTELDKVSVTDSVN
jgi:hypothetical protein